MQTEGRPVKRLTTFQPIRATSRLGDLHCMAVYIARGSEYRQSSSLIAPPPPPIQWRITVEPDTITSSFFKSTLRMLFVCLWRFFKLVSWCFEPSQPQRIISGLVYEETNTTVLYWNSERWGKQCVCVGGGGEVGVGREFHQSVLNLTITSHFHDGLPTTLKVTSLLPGIQSYHMFSV